MQMNCAFRFVKIFNDFRLSTCPDQVFNSITNRLIHLRHFEFTNCNAIFRTSGFHKQFLFIYFVHNTFFAHQISLRARYILNTTIFGSHKKWYSSQQCTIVHSNSQILSEILVAKQISLSLISIGKVIEDKLDFLDCFWIPKKSTLVHAVISSFSNVSVFQSLSKTMITKSNFSLGTFPTINGNSIGTATNVFI